MATEQKHPLRPEQLDERASAIDRWIGWFWKSWPARSRAQKLLLVLVIWLAAIPALYGTFRLLPGDVQRLLPSWVVPACAAVYAAVVAGLFVAAMVANRRERRGPHAPRPEPNRALKFLAAYDDTDEEIELFRHLERGAKLGECLAFVDHPDYRLGILSGESGCGKTSFLRAGLCPALHARNRPALYVRFTDEPLLDCFLRAVSQTKLIGKEQKKNILGKQKFETALAALIGALWPHGDEQGEDTNEQGEDKPSPAYERPLVVVFDQFEQTLQRPSEDRDRFWAELAAWWVRKDEATKILLVIPDDRVGNLSPLQALVGYTLAPMNNLFMNKFNKLEAARAFTELIKAAGLEFDPHFVENQLVPELAENDLVSPVDIQVLAWVVSLQPDGELRQFTARAYQRLGGVSGLLGRYLRMAIGTLAADSEKATALEILATLCDFNTGLRAGTKTADKIAEGLGRTARELDGMLDWLSSPGVRLVARVDRGGTDAFEIIHEKLIPAVRKVVSGMLDDVARSNELLNRRVNEWLGNGRDRRWLFTRAEYRMIEKHRALIIDSGPNRDSKEQLLEESRRQFRRQNRRVVTGLVSLLVLGTAAWFGWNSPFRVIWQCRSDTESALELVIDPADLARAAARLRSASEAQLGKKALDRCIGVTSTSDISRLSYTLGAVAEKWAGTDPRAAAELAEAIPDPLQKSLALLEAAVAWGKSDPGAAAGLIRQAAGLARSIPHPNQRSAAMGAVVERWAATDPRAAAELAGAIPGPSQRSKALRAAAAAWAVTDPKAAAEWAGTVPVPSDRSLALLEVASAWGKSDPGAAAGLIRQAAGLARSIPARVRKPREFPEPDPKSLVLLEVATAWAKSDPRAAAELAGAITDPLQRSMAMGEVAAAWVKSDPKAAAGLIRQAAEWARSITDPVERSGALLEMAAALAGTDPKAAVGLIREAAAVRLHEGFVRSGALLRAAAAWAEADPEAAAQWAQSSPFPSERSGVMRRVAAAWAKSDPKAAAKWAAEIPDSPVKAEAFLEVAASWAKADPGAAANLIRQAEAAPLFAAVSSRSEALLRAAAAWADSDPKAAAEWAGTIPDPAVRTVALRAAAAAWAEADPSAAAEWARTLPDPTERSAALLVCSYGFAKRGDHRSATSSTRDAEGVALTILDADTRSSHLRVTGELFAQLRKWELAHDLAHKCDSASDRLHILCVTLYEWSRRHEPPRFTIKLSDLVESVYPTPKFHF